MNRILNRASILTAIGLVSCSSSYRCFYADESATIATGPGRIKQPSFDATINLKKGPKRKEESKEAKLSSMVLVSGSAHPELSKEISSLIHVPLLDSTISRFSDGEASIQFNQNIRGKHVFIVQPCAAPVNDSVVELLLTISCARRSGARRVTAVIPYFGYKHHRRASSISTKHHSRYLTSGAKDFAKMLQEMGVDRVIGVDLQRPGQGHEACFFDNNVPLETIVTTDHLVSHFVNNVPLNLPLVVVAPNAECMKKARQFQLGFQKGLDSDEVALALFEDPDSGSGPRDTTHLELLGDVNIKGADVVIVDDMIDTAGTITNLSKKLVSAGAKNIYACASHGLFTENAMEIINDGAIRSVVVTNSLPLPKQMSPKVQQVSVAEMLSHVILAEHFRSVKGAPDFNEEFEMD